MKPKTTPYRSGFHLPALGILIFLFLSRASLQADAVSELASFSVFGTVDLADLAKSDVKTAHGPAMGETRYLSVQSCYVSPGSPARQMDALRQWNPLQHREL